MSGSSSEVLLRRALRAAKIVAVLLLIAISATGTVAIYALTRLIAIGL